MAALPPFIEQNPWIITAGAVLKNLVTPATLLMPNAVKNGGYVLTPVMMSTGMLFLLHGTLILSALKYGVGKLGPNNESLLFSEACEQIGEGGPPYMKDVGIYLRNFVQILEFLGHIFKCAVYLVILADTVASMEFNMSSDEPWTLKTLIVGIGLIWLTVVQFAMIPLISIVMTILGTIIILITAVFMLIAASRMTTVDELVDRYGDPTYLPLSIGQIIIVLSYFTPISNHEFRTTNLTYLMPYIPGLILYVVGCLWFGCYCYISYNEATSSMIIISMGEGQTRETCLTLVVIAICLFFLPELRKGVKALEINFETWKDAMCFPEAPKFAVSLVIHYFLIVLIIMIAIAIPNLELLSAFAGIIVIFLLVSIMPTMIFIISLLHKPFPNPSIKMFIVVGNLVVLIICTVLYVALTISIIVYVFKNYDVLAIT